MEVRNDHRHSIRPVGRVSFGERGRPAGRNMEGVAARTLAEAIAIVMVDLVEALAIADRRAVLERLANRLDDQGRTPGGSATAALLADVGAALMRLEA